MKNERPQKDNIVTIIAIGLLAYASADISHHVFGHGAACLVLGGRIISLSSVFVNCSLHGAVIDLAGPFANLVVGLVAMLAARRATRVSSAPRLFYILVTAFNLLWFALQLVFSAATNTDDWAWGMDHFRGARLLQYCMVAVGALGYLLTIRVIAAQMTSFAQPRTRARIICLTVWLTAGVFACATVALDPNMVSAILQHALPQSIVLSIGLLFIPARATRLPSSSGAEPALTLSVSWVVMAVIVGIVSIVFLGPGVTIAI